MNLPKAAIIILNWNGYKDTAECLLSLKNLDYTNHEIIIVDNGSADGSPDRIKKEFPYVALIRNSKNLGFAEGSNAGIRRALKEGAEFVLLLNNDTTVEPDFLKLLAESAAKDDKIGIASPKIMFYHDPEKIWFAGGYYLPLIKKPSHKYFRQLDRGQVKDITEVDWVSGCCMLIRKEVFEKIGMLDADYCYSYEDVDFCARAIDKGFKIILAPDSRIYHKYASSFKGIFSPLYTYYRTRNNLLFFKKTNVT
jgi:GT2 family glycosyltransferase